MFEVEGNIFQRSVNDVRDLKSKSYIVASMMLERADKHLTA